ncbi:hypothetical protein A2777_06155 [Candidatus Gottesmanbacteria bacterium RIFCSPHIGHO2_01_FULL_40_15]|uniref:Aminotransferase class I/classII domain-containing protein n=1 Tax=Candidatus Gottesmanbacteria bacterium RIFCSPHIGHO2_01_FULL_40_15 TaxID=1798376 RepID=A0A1F5Z765_9BACT|nr:MAG: hypothetical protein A2777_06155 [Candidatus Gottesmanbacteria bacterium RIFCSPHIGHO2_01_FULL_40_15]
MNSISSAKTHLLPEAISELRDDIYELKFLYWKYRERLTLAGREINRAEKFIDRTVYAVAKTDLEHFINLYGEHISNLNKILKNAERKKASPEIYEELLKTKNGTNRLLRSQAAVSSAVIIQTDWQSPSFNYSLVSQAGRQTGKVSGTFNDYKRDVHLDEKEYEELFLKEYIDAGYKFLLKSFLTNSGQAAFQTILTYLTCEKKTSGRILIGESSYFQYKQILVKTFGDKLITVAETNTHEIIDKIITYSPSVVFFDSLCNSADLPVPDLRTLIEYIYKNIKKDIYIIIDNSCMAFGFQPFLLRRSNRNVHMMSFESLNKFYQFGLDRVTAGIIICENRDAGGIFEYRKHAGTNITDSSVFAMATPSRKLLQKRLFRHNRNALYLSKGISESVSGKQKSIIDDVLYPQLKGHPAYTFMKNAIFGGTFFNIGFKKRYDNPKYMKLAVDSIIKEAKIAGVDIVAGTSFGLNTTRIYLTSLWSKFGKPFFRISAGTEDIIQAERIKKVLQDSMVTP